MLFDRFQLEPGEQVLVTVRRHWFILAIELIGVALMALMPFLALFFISITPLREFVEFSNSAIIMELGLFFTLGWLCLSVMAGYMVWTHYYLDLWIVTDRRIIMIDQVYFFNRAVSSLRLERVQDLVVVVSGIIQTFLNFGHIRLQTAGAEKNNFLMLNLPDPHGLLVLIQSANDKRIATSGAKKRGCTNNCLPNWLHSPTIDKL